MAEPLRQEIILFQDTTAIKIAAYDAKSAYAD